jgi:hypothetical protein
VSDVLSGIARLTPLFPNQSSAHIARGSARDGGINKQSEEFQISQKFPVPATENTGGIFVSYQVPFLFFLRFHRWWFLGI